MFNLKADYLKVRIVKHYFQCLIAINIRFLYLQELMFIMYVYVFFCVCAHLRYGLIYQNVNI